MTTEIYLNPIEVKLLLPVLERILNGVATERIRKHYAGMLSPFARPVYEARTFNEELFGHILSSRNKLKGVGRSRKLRMNVFELASLGLSFRVARKECLAGENMKPSALDRLERKLENCRKRAKRSWIRSKGRESFSTASQNWKRLVAWLRFEILAPRKRRPLPSKSISMLAKEHRSFMRCVARHVTVAGADDEDIQHLADLARREVKRKRHPFTMRDLIRDPTKARLFMATFILDRRNYEVLKFEYLPKSLQMSKRAISFAAALNGVSPDPNAHATLAK